MIIPKDLKKFSISYLLKKMIPFILLEGVITAVVILFGERMFGKTNIWFRIPAIALLLLIPVFLTKIYKETSFVYHDRRGFFLVTFWWRFATLNVLPRANV